MEAKKEKKHSLCEKSPVLAMILTVPLGLLSQLGSIVPGTVGYILVAVLAIVVLVLFDKWFSPGFEGVFKPCVSLKESLIITSPMIIVIIGAVIINVISCGFSFKPSFNYLCLAVMAGCNEETAFRAMLIAIGMKYLKGNNRSRTVVIISSVIFGVIHVTNLTAGADLVMTIAQILMAICAGLVLAAIYLRTGSIILGMIAHSIYDFINFITDSTINESGIVTAAPEGSKTIVAVSIIIISAILAFAGIFMIRKSKTDDIEKIWQKKWTVDQ